ncbi:histone acetyltransferase p300-like [Pseudoliparis swirei]|uniref:histone acetyltransferase p300-like n=1 Tax=Pseudoliparis swirei TaxID=2059687 RepID=UPI0024BEA9BC|nr:histone acetyltransferase p300-like [Pseudoliparis swirei]
MRPQDTKGDSKNAKKKNNKKTSKNKSSLSRANKKPGMPNVSNDLSQKLYATMEKHKEVFFVIRLIAAPMANALPPISDPDPLMACDLMDGRDAFLTLARDKHLEFSSLRRSMWSSMCMLVELHVHAGGAAQPKPGPLRLHLQRVQAPRGDSFPLYRLRGESGGRGYMFH